MSNAKTGGSDPPTRDPVTHGRAAVEGGLMTMIGTVVAWGLGFLPVEVPVEVQMAIVGIIVTIGALCFSEIRNRQYAATLIGRTQISLAFVPLLLAVALVVGCVSWDGAGYKKLAGDEIVKLVGQPNTTPISPGTCDALAEGAVTLRNKEGESKSIKAPFFAGPKIEPLAKRHERVAAICYEMARRDLERGVVPSLRTQFRSDWLRIWRNGRALQGGLQEEE